jgi:putative ABC transport system permease protein
VEYAALISELPLSGQENDAHFTIEERPPVTPGNRPDEDARMISADYFRAMGIPLVEGRYFSDADNLKARRVAIVNRSFAREYFPNQNPIGQYLNIDFGINFRCEIVGVVGDARHHSIASAPAPTMYVPYAQRSFARTNIVIRSRTPRLVLLAEVKHEVQALNKDIPVYGVHMMDELVSDSVSEPRFRTLLLGTFAAIAMILAAVGIYGVISYAVTQRTHEIGIRRAFGAERADVVGLVVGQVLVPILIGVATGLAGAFVLTRFLASMLYGVRPTDPLTFVVVSLVLTGTALLACYLPARRATKVDPMEALRYE